METIHLNAHGFNDYRDKYGETIYNLTRVVNPAPEAWQGTEPRLVNEVIHRSTGLEIGLD